MIASDIQSKALLLHHGRSSGAVDLTVHDVIALPARDEPEPTQAFTLGAGRVLGFEEKAEIVRILTLEVNESLKLTHERLLGKTPYAIAWWIPSAKRQIVFRCEGKIEHVTVTMPTLVAIYCRGSLHFAAVKGCKRQRPDGDKPLYAVPLPNLYSSGSFCTGNATVAKGARESNIPEWEAFVFDTVNTHLGGQKPLSGLDDNYSNERMVELYREFEGTGRFPTNRMVSLNVTLSSWMHNIDKGLF